jgi:hypothetical protein
MHGDPLLAFVNFSIGKRIIAIPRDAIEGKLDSEGYPEVYLNDEKLKESYVNLKVPFRIYVNNENKFQFEPADLKADKNKFYIGIHDGKTTDKNVFRQVKHDILPGIYNGIKNIYNKLKNKMMRKVVD